MNRKRISFLNTFDYELYLGKASGTAENCVLKPTNLLLQILGQHQLPAIFFVDATYLCRLKEMAVNHPQALKDFDSICFQLKQIKKEGHKIYLHLHPHWMDAKYNANTNKWNLSDKRHFNFSSLSNEQREEIFNSAYHMLAGIIEDAIEGFRAGGLYIQPFSDFHSLFVKHGIKYEFSVLRGAYSKEVDGHSFDFTAHLKPFVYRFENDVLKKSAKGSFVEFTVNTIEVPFAHRLANKVANKFFSPKNKSARFGDGLPSGNKIFFQSQSKNSLIESLGVENISIVKEQLYLLEASRNSYIHLLSHPKLISPYTLSIYDDFLRKLKLKFEMVTELDSILKMQAA